MASAATARRRPPAGLAVATCFVAAAAAFACQSNPRADVGAGPKPPSTGSVAPAPPASTPPPPRTAADAVSVAWRAHLAHTPDAREAVARAQALASPDAAAVDADALGGLLVDDGRTAVVLAKHQILLADNATHAVTGAILADVESFFGWPASVPKSSLFLVTVDGKKRLYDARTGLLVETFPYAKSTISDDGSSIALLDLHEPDNADLVALYDVGARRMRWRAALPRAQWTPGHSHLNGLVFADDGRALLGFEPWIGEVYVPWALETSDGQRIATQPSGVTSAPSFSANGSVVAFVDADADGRTFAHVIERATGKTLGKASACAPVKTVHLDRSGRMLAVGSGRGASACALEVPAMRLVGTADVSKLGAAASHDQPLKLAAMLDARRLYVQRADSVAGLYEVPKMTRLWWSAEMSHAELDPEGRWRLVDATIAKPAVLTPDAAGSIQRRDFTRDDELRGDDGKRHDVVGVLTTLPPWRLDDASLQAITAQLCVTGEWVLPNDGCAPPP